ncbi:response regulator [Thalassobaculum sp. OXR-137]|uniref:response regulator n=1 Tax=Thalassobaculum sp. OXR-137 TaxID=3100173 RepID=UPI002AC99057|nr:response regulator [Thalassobaculum sp. OXR-137]WPZ33923.1 response regulator [Thalassobaculum sp. OXR-137]
MSTERWILLLEDDMIQTMLFRAAVDGVLGTVLNFTDLSEALAQMRRMEVDLCVVDLGVFTQPGVFHLDGGNRFIAEVRSKISRTTPIIVATSGRKPESLIASFRAGADDYVLKDEGLDKVVDRIRLWMGKIPIDRIQLETQRVRLLNFLEKAEKNRHDLPE